jgi:hypothetical protein
MRIGSTVEMLTFLQQFGVRRHPKNRTDARIVLFSRDARRAPASLTHRSERSDAVQGFPAVPVTVPMSIT